MTVMPVDVLLIGAVPLFIAAVYASWIKWRDDHPRHKPDHAAE